MSERTKDPAELCWIEIDTNTTTCNGRRILAEPFPPRPESDRNELISSVRLHGVICPVLLRPAGDDLQVVSGRARLESARAAGVHRVPAIVRPLADAEAIRCYLSAKVIRKPLSSMMQHDALAILREIRDGVASNGGEPPRGRRDGDAREDVPGRVDPKRTGSADHRSAASRERGTSRSRAPGRPAGRLARVARDRQAVTSWIVASPEDVSLCQRPGERLSQATAALLETIRSSRTIDPASVERLVDQLLAGCISTRSIELSELYGGETAYSTTAPHSVLVALLAGRVATALGWSDETVRRFVVGALLHDVGMVFVEERGLLEPGGLTREQRDAIPQHTTIGHALITAAAAWHAEVAQCARDHHERWNGRGYPAGKLRGSVALPARLLGYLDTFGALVSPRPHRSALRPEAAFERLRQAAELGLFDPGLLSPVLDALGKISIRPAGSFVSSRVSGENCVELALEPATMQTSGTR